VQRVAEREVVLLDREDVREVGRELDLERERQRPSGVAAHDDGVLHPLADVTGPGDRQLVAAEPADDRVPHEERRRERLALDGREKQRTQAVHGEDAAREEPRVVGEEARGRAVDVAPLVADAEGRPVEDRQRHGGHDNEGSGPLETNI
jgi:hypothetical protein